MKKLLKRYINNSKMQIDTDSDEVMTRQSIWGFFIAVMFCLHIFYTLCFKFWQLYHLHVILTDY